MKLAEIPIAVSKNYTIPISGIPVTYSVYRLPSGIYNVGRIVVSR